MRPEIPAFYLFDSDPLKLKMIRYLLLLGIFFMIAYEVYGVLPCEDKLKPDYCVKDENNKKYCKCKKFIKKNPSACEKYGTPGDICCKTCSKADSCYDSKQFTYTVGGKKYHCKKLIKKFPFLCALESVKKYCCKSCKKRKEPKGDCEDNPKFSITITVSYNNKSHTCKRCSCDDIEAKGIQFAAVACTNSLVMENCCEMCNSLE